MSGMSQIELQDQNSELRSSGSFKVRGIELSNPGLLPRTHLMGACMVYEMHVPTLQPNTLHMALIGLISAANMQVHQ